MNSTPPIRRAQVPDRIVGDKVVLARPGCDEAVILGGMAAAVWVELDRWTSIDAIEAALASADDVAVGHDAAALVADAIELLRDEGLLETRSD